MKLKRRIVILLGTIFLSLVFFTLTKVVIANHNDETNDIRLVAAFPFTGIPPQDVQLIEEKINEITEKEIGVTVDFPELSTSFRYYEEVTMMLSTTEQLDIMMGGFGSFMDCYVDKKLIPLDDLLDKYGQDILTAVGKERIQGCKIHDAIYGIPINGDCTQQENCFVLRKDILDKLDIDANKITSLEKLEKVFALVKEKIPDIQVLSSGDEPNSTVLSNLGLLDTSRGRVPLTASLGQETELVRIFESEKYINELKRVRRWHLKGYTKEDIFGETESVASKIAEGKLFAYTTKKGPWSQKSDNFMVGGMEMVRICLGENIIYNAGSAFMPYVITRNSVSPEASMKLLNLFYSNKDIANLLCYGVEGIHYKKTKDGHITDADEEKRNPFRTNGYNMPNQYITYVWEDLPLDYWEQIKKQNESAFKGNKNGFNFDYGNVDAEYTKIVKIYESYRCMLENGLANPEEGRKRMLDEMEKSGLSFVLDEEEKQYNMWKNRGRGENK